MILVNPKMLKKNKCARKLYILLNFWYQISVFFLLPLPTFLADSDIDSLISETIKMIEADKLNFVG